VTSFRLEGRREALDDRIEEVIFVLHVSEALILGEAYRSTSVCKCVSK
jgi:hypothetical protein